jgi:hypothetical protein
LKAKEKKAFASGGKVALSVAKKLINEYFSQGASKLFPDSQIPTTMAIGALIGGGLGAASGALVPDEYEEEDEYGQKQLKTRSRLDSALHSGGLGALTGSGIGLVKGLVRQGVKQSSARTMTHLAASGSNFNPTQFNAKAPGNVYAGGLGGGLNGSAVGNNWGQAVGTNAAAISESGRTKVSADGKDFGFFHYSANKPTIGDGDMNAVYNFGHNLGNLALNSQEKRAFSASDVALLGALAALQEKTAVGPIRQMIQNRPRLFPNLGRRRGQVAQYEEPAVEETSAPESAPPPATFNAQNPQHGALGGPAGSNQASVGTNTFNAQNPQHGALGGLPGSVMNSVNKFKGNQMVNGAASSALTGGQSALSGLAQGAGSVLGNAGNALRNSAQGMAQKATALGQMDKNVRNLPSDQAADANIGLLRDNIRQFAPQAFSKTPPAAATGGNTGTIYDTYRQPAAAARPVVNPYARTGNISGMRGRDF